MNSESKQRPAGESEVWNAIAAFERILEAMPNDRVALETLYQAYEQIGQTAQAVDYLVQLGQTVVDEKDFAAAPKILAKLKNVPEDNAAADMAVKLEQLLTEAPESTQAEKKPALEGKRKTVDITSELSLAWNLLQAGELTQDQYSVVVHDLSEQSTKEVLTPVSVLHALQDQKYNNLEKILVFLSKDSGTPVLALSHFEIQSAVYSLLPLELMQTRGALVFEVMGPDLLVAILNPYNEELREAVRHTTGKKCHFYIVSPTDYDKGLDAIRTALLTPVEA